MSDTKTGGKVLIAYFSWGGNTRGIAQEIQSQTGADIFEISPVEPYSADYNTVLMEAQEDQHNQARPELSGHVENMDDYDTILLGYPNWWASIPMPIASFLEEYDFSGKTIILFATSGGSGMGNSAKELRLSVSDGAVIKDGKRFSANASVSELKEWVNSLGI